MGIQKPIFYSAAKIVEDMNNFHQIADNTFGSLLLLFREPLKSGLKRENTQSAPDSRKADEARLNALRGGLTQKAVCYADFSSNKGFRGDLENIVGGIYI